MIIRLTQPVAAMLVSAMLLMACVRNEREGRQVSTRGDEVFDPARHSQKVSSSQQEDLVTDRRKQAHAQMPEQEAAVARALTGNNSEAVLGTAASGPRSGEGSQETQERSRLKQEFQDLSSKIAELRERAKAVESTRTRERVVAALSELEGKRRALAQSMENIDDWRTSASMAWQDMRDGLVRALQELRQAYDKAKSHF